jgi:small subunit ribosomal protein S17e
MGKVRTKTVKRSAKILVEKYYSRLNMDFQSVRKEYKRDKQQPTNPWKQVKKLVSEVTIMPSKRVRNKISGYCTKLMKRIARSGTVRGISLKLQEEERERRLDFIPEIGALDKEEVINVDGDTEAMLQSIGMSNLRRVKSTTTSSSDNRKSRGDRHQRS